MGALQNDRLRSMPASFLPPSPVNKPGTKGATLYESLTLTLSRASQPGVPTTCWDPQHADRVSGDFSLQSYRSYIT